MAAPEKSPAPVAECWTCCDCWTNRAIHVWRTDTCAAEERHRHAIPLYADTLHDHRSLGHDVREVRP